MSDSNKTSVKPTVKAPDKTASKPQSKQLSKPPSNSNSSNTAPVVEEVLPLLSAKEACKLANSGTPEQELQKVADLIRSRAMGFYYDLQVVDLNNAEYIYNELIKEGYIVLFIDIRSLNIMWKQEYITA